MTGANDKQADPAQVDEWAAVFKAAGNRDVTARVLPNLDHLFVYDTDGYPGNYIKLPTPVRMEQAVVGMIVDWLTLRLRRRS